ncbi:MAG: aminotransferase class V-fold PLP-dependent enzyme [Kineosporiaceae bacterium]
MPVRRRGSTEANLAAALAVAGPGREVVVSRTLHRSMLSGLVLSGARPVWVRPEVDPEVGLPGGVSPSAVADALAAHPGAAAVLVGDPSYAGLVGDVAGLAEVAHAAGVPLVVDAAWAAHFGASSALPPHPLALGADVVVTSAHKALPAYSQGAVLLARTGLVDADRLARAVDAVHTTSPAGAILASVDAARALLELDGEQLGRRLAGSVAAARARLAAVPGVRVLEDAPGRVVDPAKLVVLLAGAGASGNVVEADLLERGHPLEMADRDLVVAMVTVADPPERVAAVAGALADAIVRHSGPPRPVRVAASWDVDPDVAMTPREAFFAPHETVPASAAVGRVSAELIAPYPPGVPVLAPGEVITAGALHALRETRTEGGRIAYAADPTLATLQVVA